MGRGSAWQQALHRQGFHARGGLFPSPQVRAHDGLNPEAWEAQALSCACCRRCGAAATRPHSKDCLWHGPPHPVGYALCTLAHPLHMTPDVRCRIVWVSVFFAPVWQAAPLSVGAAGPASCIKALLRLRLTLSLRAPPPQASPGTQGPLPGSSGTKRALWDGACTRRPASTATWSTASTAIWSTAGKQLAGRHAQRFEPTSAHGGGHWKPTHKGSHLETPSSQEP